MLLDWFQTPVPRPRPVLVIGLLGVLLALPNLILLPVIAAVAFVTCREPDGASMIRDLGAMAAVVITVALFLVPMAISLFTLWTSLNLIRLREWARVAAQVLGVLLTLLVASMMLDVVTGGTDSSGDGASVAERFIFGTLGAVVMTCAIWAVAYLSRTATREVFQAAELARCEDPPRREIPWPSGTS